MSRTCSCATRGYALLNALLVASLIFFFSFAVVNLGLFHYQAAQRQAQSLQALEAAQSGLSEAVRMLSLEPASQPLIRGSSYEVRFAAGDSTNNLGGFLPVTGWKGRVVPAHCAHILARGFTPGGGHRTLEAVVELQALPFPVQSLGAVRGQGISVAGAGSAALFESDGARLPGSIYAGQSVALEGTSLVSGGIRTAGSVSLGPTVSVAGKIEEHTSPLEVPDLDIAQFDNSEVAGVRVLASGTYANLAPLRGEVYIEGDVRFVGGLVLDSAVVFVGNGGNLSIDGLVTGKGTLFVTGKTSMASGLMVNDDSQIAIFSQKELEITNSALPLVSVFQGVLYSHANIKLGPAVTVLGAVISRADLELSRLNQVVSIPEHLAFASYWLARGAGGAPMKLDYWAELP